MGQPHRRNQFGTPGHDKIVAKKEQAHAIKRVLDRETGGVVGWLYEWNTGQVGVMWKDGARTDVVHE
jgi:hypothetical protein